VGPVVTAGGLIFTGTRDRKVRAFDVETERSFGRKSWMPRWRAFRPSMKSPGNSTLFLCGRPGGLDAGHSTSDPGSVRGVCSAGCLAALSGRRSCVDPSPRNVYFRGPVKIINPAGVADIDCPVGLTPLDGPTTRLHVPHVPPCGPGGLPHIANRRTNLSSIHHSAIGLQK